MATYEGSMARSTNIAIDSALQGEVKCVYGEYDLSVAIADADVFKLVTVPQDHVVIDCVLDVDELDTGVDAITISVGDVDNAAGNLIADSTVGQAGGIARREVGGTIAPTTDEVTYGVTVTAAPGTGASTGKIRLSVLYRAECRGI